MESLNIVDPSSVVPKKSKKGKVTSRYDDLNESEEATKNNLKDDEFLYYRENGVTNLH